MKGAHHKPPPRAFNYISFPHGRMNARHRYQSIIKIQMDPMIRTYAERNNESINTLINLQPNPMAAVFFPCLISKAVFRSVNISTG